METRKTFVLWITQPPTEEGESQPVLEGRLEDVDTGREIRFRSAAQLITFLEQTLEGVKRGA
ncbi:MAG: hypothetical protein U0R19_12285 [Bryobacteraceae bacterium]